MPAEEGAGPKTLGDTLPPGRPRWEAMSSSESLGAWKDQPVPTEDKAPTFESQDSYVLDSLRTGSLDSLVGNFEEVKFTKSSRLSSMMDTSEVASPPKLARIDHSEALSPRKTATSAPAWQPNAAAAEFVPSSMAASSSPVGGGSGMPFDAPTPATRTNGLIPVIAFPTSGRSPVAAATEEDVPFVRRRATKKRKKTLADVAMPGGSSPSAGPSAEGADAEDEGIDEEEKFRRWIVKRTHCVASIKETTEYTKFAALKSGGHIPLLEQECGAAAPSTPDACDSKISKRSWEALTQKWRSSLREWSEKRPIPPAAD